MTLVLLLHSVLDVISLVVLSICLLSSCSSLYYSSIALMALPLYDDDDYCSDDNEYDR